MHQKAKEALNTLNKRVKDLFGLDLNISLSFDLKGNRTIGQCKKITKKTYLIRLHEPLLFHYKEIYLDDVLTHEIAHAVQMELYKNRVKPHGKEWVRVLEGLIDKPYNPKLNPKYEKLKDISISKSYKKFPYTCKCETIHNLTSIRHERAKKGTIYLCRYCKSMLTLK